MVRRLSGRRLSHHRSVLKRLEWLVLKWLVVTLVVTHQAQAESRVVRKRVYGSARRRGGRRPSDRRAAHRPWHRAHRHRARVGRFPLRVGSHFRGPPSLGVPLTPKVRTRAGRPWSELVCEACLRAGACKPVRRRDDVQYLLQLILLNVLGESASGAIPSPFFQFPRASVLPKLMRALQATVAKTKELKKRALGCYAFTADNRFFPFWKPSTVSLHGSLIKRALGPSRPS